MPRRKLWLSKKDAAAINRFPRGVLSLTLKTMRAREEPQI